MLGYCSIVYALISQGKACGTIEVSMYASAWKCRCMYMNTSIYIYIYIHTYIHTYIYIYIDEPIDSRIERKVNRKIDR